MSKSQSDRQENIQCARQTKWQGDRLTVWPYGRIAGQLKSLLLFRYDKMWLNRVNNFCFHVYAQKSLFKVNKSGLFSCPAILPYGHTVCLYFCISDILTFYFFLFTTHVRPQPWASAKKFSAFRLVIKTKVVQNVNRMSERYAVQTEWQYDRMAE